MSEVEQTDSSTLKVLVADDDIPTRMLLRAAISQWGYDVTEASDGEAAWQLLNEPDAPRLLIIDWLMPKLDGIALCQRIRSQLNFHPYIVLLTQVTGITNLITGLEAGADEFLSKPFNMAELKSRLSIGARIINNENRLAEQHKKLKVDIDKLRAVLLPAIHLTEEINSTCSLGTTPNQATLGQCFEKIKQLQQELEKIKNIVDGLQMKSSKDDHDQEKS